jgi:DNA-binding transcriptional MerR regulator
MLSMQEIAIEAVQARYEGSFYYGEFLKELESHGLSSAEIQELLENARAMVPHPQAPRALRILKRASRLARRGEAERAKNLRAAACGLVGSSEAEALIEEHRLAFTPEMKSSDVLERPRARSFAL